MRHLVLSLACLLPAVPSAAQTRAAEVDAAGEAQDAPPLPAPRPTTRSAGTLAVGNGVIGQRQMRSDAAPGLEPLARIQNRIANRVQNRLRNRIDRYYDPQANALTPFSVASDQARTGQRRSGR